MKRKRRARLVRTGWLAPVLLALVASTAWAEDEAEPEPLWSGSAGLSLVATGGNTDTRTVGAELQLTRRPAPWGIKITAGFTIAEQDGENTAERYAAGLRGERALNQRWSLFAGASGERDLFAGIDLRTIVESGVTYAALSGPTHKLSLDGGLTWTREDTGSAAWEGSEDALGALLGVSWAWQLSDTASLGERLVWFPNFEVSGDWRATSETALQASLSSRLALKLAYLLRYDHDPVPGFEDTDTTTTVSLVVTL